MSYKRWQPGRASTRGSCYGESPSVSQAQPEDWGTDSRLRQVGSFIQGQAEDRPGWLPCAVHSIALAFSQQTLHSLVHLLCLESNLYAKQRPLGSSSHLNICEISCLSCFSEYFILPISDLEDSASQGAISAPLLL